MKFMKLILEKVQAFDWDTLSTLRKFCSLSIVKQLPGRTSYPLDLPVQSERNARRRRTNGVSKDLHHLFWAKSMPFTHSSLQPDSEDQIRIVEECLYVCIGACICHWQHDVAAVSLRDNE